MSSLSIKHILSSNNNWWNFYNKFENFIRPDILSAVVKLLSCKETIRGYHHYDCSNPECPHFKRLPHTCKSKACSSCGKKATELWIKQQSLSLPDTAWQHITFTMPSQLWDFFWLNRQLLNSIAKIAAHSVLALAKKKLATPAIFVAIHTFGRDLKRNVHIHLSTTTGGISNDLSQWKSLFFSQHALMTQWRYQIISLFRLAFLQHQLSIPNHIQKTLNPHFSFNQFLNKLYNKTWIVHCSKPSLDFKKNLNYFSRYVKRPPISESRLRHYDGQSVTFNFLDHRSKSKKNLKLSVEQFIAAFIQHIPDKGFRMIRYYGVLANRVRSALLPILYQLILQNPPPDKQKNDSLLFADLMKQSFSSNPMICPLCGSTLMFSFVRHGITNLNHLLYFHQDLATSKKS